MRVVETRASIGPEGLLTVQLPSDVPEGSYAVVIVLAESPAQPEEEYTLDDFPVDNGGPWPEGLSLRREDMYDDWGR
jgi:hypothetical protein